AILSENDCGEHPLEDGPERFR
ncbi:hypothetical protein LCGC14_3090040, partial [marine sediment metagenome]